MGSQPERDPNDGRDEKGRFVKGNPGGPGGPRRKASELRKAAEDAITSDHITALVRKATRMGLEGDLGAIRLVLERTCGRAPLAPMGAEPVDVAIPALHTASDCNDAVGTLIEGICEGTVDRDAAKLLIDAIGTRLRSIEVNELEERLVQLEESTRQVGGGRR